MATIVTRTGKGSPLTWQEADANFTNLNTFTQNGTGSISRVLETKVKEMVSVKDFGAVGDGITDDSVAIQAAFALGASIGRRVFFPVGIYAHTTTLYAKYDGLYIEGETSAGHVFGLSTEVTKGTVLKWTGSAGGIQMIFGADPSAIPNNAVSGGQLRNIQFDGNGVAGYNLQTVSVANSSFANLVLKNATVQSLTTGVINDSYGDLNNTYRCSYTDIVVVVGGTAHGIVVEGSNIAGKNTCFCTFSNIHVTYLNGTGWLYHDMDDCTFTNVATSRSAGGSGDAFILNSGTVGKGVHGNYWFGIHAGKADGTDPKIWVKGGATQPSRRNIMYISGIDYGIKPTIDSGAQLFYLYLGRNTGVDTDFSDGALFRTPPLQIQNYLSADTKTLDWYEEGTFTPVLKGSTTSGTPTYAAQVGEFTRIGDRVFFNLRVDITAIGGIVGNLQITGIPYTQPAAPNGQIALAVANTRFDLSAGYTQVAALVGNSGSTITLQQLGDNIASVSLTDANLLASSTIMISGHYRVTA